MMKQSSCEHMARARKFSSIGRVRSFNREHTPYSNVAKGRKGETISHSLLAQHKLAPSLLARFENGLMYRFIRGRVCRSTDLSNESVYKGVARKLGEWHAVLPVVFEDNSSHVANGEQNGLSSPKHVPSVEQINKITPKKSAPNLWTVMQKWIFALPTRTENDHKRKDTLQDELNRTVKELGDTPGLGKDGVCALPPLSSIETT